MFSFAGYLELRTPPRTNKNQIHCRKISQDIVTSGLPEPIRENQVHGDPTSVQQKTPTRNIICEDLAGVRSHNTAGGVRMIRQVGKHSKSHQTTEVCRLTWNQSAKERYSVMRNWDITKQLSYRKSYTSLKHVTTSPLKPENLKSNNGKVSGKFTAIREKMEYGPSIE